MCEPNLLVAPLITANIAGAGLTLTATTLIWKNIEEPIRKFIKEFSDDHIVSEFFKLSLSSFKSLSLRSIFAFIISEFFLAAYVIFGYTFIIYMSYFAFLLALFFIADLLLKFARFLFIYKG